MESQSAGSRFCPEQPWFVLNATKQYRVAVSADPSISHFYSFQVDDPEHVTIAIPDGCVDIIIDCDSSGNRARICGSPTEVRTFELIHEHRYFGVRFTPGYVPRFRNLSPCEIKGREFGLTEVVTDLDEILGKIHENQSFRERCDLFESYLKSNIPRRPTELTQSVLGLLRQSRGTLPMKALEANFSCTERTIQRLFKEDTGMSPKAFSRILRCHSALELLTTSTKTSFLDVALELGFSDQSHFQREFKSLVNTTPMDYVKHLSHMNQMGRIHYVR